MQDVNSDDRSSYSRDPSAREPFADATREATDTAIVANASQGATILSCSANSNSAVPTCVARRALLVTVLATCIGVVANKAHAQDDAPGSDERPQKADLLVFAEGEHAGEIIKPNDLKAGGPPVRAWPMDPGSKVVRKGSRLNELLVVRLDPAEIDDETRPRAADGILAYTAVCSHAGCTVTAWVKQAEGDKTVFKCMCHNSEFDPRQSGQVVFGPAPRRLAVLPLQMAEQSITVAAAFVGKVGLQK